MSPPTTSLQERPWRQVNRHIFAQLGSEPSRSDPEVAISCGSVVVSDVIAHHIVVDHNRELERRNGE